MAILNTAYFKSYTSDVFLWLEVGLLSIPNDSYLSLSALLVSLISLLLVDSDTLLVFIKAGFMWFIIVTTKLKITDIK